MNAPDGRANPCKCIPFLLTLSGVIFTTSMPASAQLSPALDRFSVTVGAFQADPKFNGNVNTPLGTLHLVTSIWAPKSCRECGLTS